MVITRNIDKINYFLGVKLNEIIKLCIVDISSVIISESEYLSIHEIKKQTKYLFNLSNKEINFKERNELVNNGDYIFESGQRKQALVKGIVTAGEKRVTFQWKNLVSITSSGCSRSASAVRCHVDDINTLDMM